MASSVLTFENINAQNVRTLSTYAGSEKPLCEGPKILPVQLSFALIERYLLDFSNQMKQGRMSLVQSAFIDASNLGPDPGGLLVEFPDTGQHIFAKASTQGFYPVLACDPLRVVFECHAHGFGNIYLCNFMMPPCVWTSELV